MDEFLTDEQMNALLGSQGAASNIISDEEMNALLQGGSAPQAPDASGMVPSPLEAESEAKRKRLSALVSGLSGAAEGLTFGYGDEAVAGGAAGLDYLMSLGKKDFGTEYDKYMSLQNQAANEYSKINTTADLLASVLNPLNKYSQGKNALSTIGKGIGIGAVEGFGRNEDNRLGGAALGGALGGALPLATETLKAGGKVAADLGRKFQRGVIVSEAAQKASSKTPMLASDAFDIAQKEGMFKGSLSGEALKARNKSFLKETGQKLSSIKKQVASMIPESDIDSMALVVKGSKDGISLNTKNEILKENLRFDKTSAFLNKIKKPSVRDEAERLIKENYDQYFGKSGTLRNLDIEEMFDTASFLRRGQYSAKETITPLQKSIDKAIGEDIAESATRIADNIVGKGKIGQVNKTYQALKTLEPITKELGNKEAVTSLGKALMFSPTNNPFINAGVTGLAAGSSWFIPQTAPLFLGAKILGTRKGQMLLSQGLENLGKGSKFVGEKTPATELARALQVMLNK